MVPAASLLSCCAEGTLERTVTHAVSMSATCCVLKAVALSLPLSHTCNPTATQQAFLGRLAVCALRCVKDEHAAKLLLCLAQRRLLPCPGDLRAFGAQASAPYLHGMHVTRALVYVGGI